MDKCNKLEELFVNGTEAELLSHIEVCETCRQEYERMKKVSGLIQEVKPHYLKKKQLIRKIQKIAAVFIFAVFTATTAAVYMNEDLSDTLMYGNTLTAEDYGFPVDSYGLLMVD